MPKRAAAGTVAVTHPSGKFAVHVSPARALVLIERGYTEGDTSPPKEDRPTRRSARLAAARGARQAPKE